MKAVLDTNFIVNLLFVDQPFHEEAKKLWKVVSKAYLPSTVVFELTYIFYKYECLEYLGYILSDEKVEYTETKLHDVLFALNQNPKTYDDFNDYIILHTALRLKANLLTFDKKLKDEIEKRF